MVVVWVLCCHDYVVNVVFDVLDILGSKGALCGISKH